MYNLNIWECFENQMKDWQKIKVQKETNGKL